MNVDESVKRLIWRFSQKSNGSPKAFTPNQNDLEAVKVVAQWIEAQQQETIREQQLFAKLFVNELTRIFAMTKDLKFSIGQMNFICKMPLSHYTDLFNFMFNNLKYQMYCDSKGIPNEMPDKFTEEERNLVLEHVKSDPEFAKYLGGYWPKEKTEESLSNQITETIQKFKNEV